jgi:NADP-dependent 3-hydroxy acid dehydrogenase YdfG
MPLRRSPRPLAGRVVLITGAGRGIGRATAAQLLARGARVALGDLSAPTLDGPLAGHGDRALALALDVTDDASFAAFADEAGRALGPVDVLVNNAGIMPIGPFLEEPPAATRRQVDVNLHGVITGTRLVLPAMLARGAGHVVNIGSAASLIGLPGEAVYCATKHAVLGFSEAVRTEVRARGVDVTVVMPNLAGTDLGAGMSPAKGSKLLTPDEVAAAIVGAIERPRFEVPVPRSIGGQLKVRRLLPVAVRDALGIDDVATQVRTAERAAYQAELDRSGV